MAGRKAKVVEEGMKYCGRCSSELPLTAFWSGQTWCKSCMTTYQKKWVGDRGEDHHYLSKYGVTKGDVQKMNGFIGCNSVLPPHFYELCDIIAYALNGSR